MSQKLDPDLKGKTLAQLRQEVMSWRNAARQEVCNVGNGRCWTRLVANLPESKKLRPIDLPRNLFLGNCARYYDRNHTPSCAKRAELEKLLAEGQELGHKVEKEMRPLFRLRFDEAEHVNRVRPAIKRLDRLQAEAAAQAHSIPCSDHVRATKRRPR